MSAETAAGHLIRFAEGRLEGTLSATALGGYGSVTIEVYAHGILTASGPVAVPPGVTGTLAFHLPVTRFARVRLPAVLSARIVETDTALDCAIEIADLDALWTAMLPYRPVIEGVREGALRIRIPGRLLHPDAELFELHEGGEVLARGVPQEGGEDDATHYAIPLPPEVLDGAEHAVFVRHAGTGLPLQLDPVRVALNVGGQAAPALVALEGRMNALERQMRDRHADAFNGLALRLYQHLDTVTLTQRANFEREIAALRRLLDVPDPAPEPAPQLAEEIRMSFEREVPGYGIYPVSHTGTGKAYRYVTPHSGFLLPGMVAADADLVVQGLKRWHEALLDGAELFLNGMAVDIRTYVNPRPESWNITARVPAAALRADRNLLELRLPAALPADPAPEIGERAAGIMELRLTPAPPAEA